MLPVAVARSSNGNAIRYVLPVLWMTSCFPIMELIGQNQRRVLYCKLCCDISCCNSMTSHQLQTFRKGFKMLLFMNE